MARNEFVILAGISGAGKSRYADYLKDDGYFVVSSDAIRQELGDINDQSRNPFVFGLAKSRIMSYLAYGVKCVLDATNLSAEHLEPLLTDALAYDARIVVLVIHCAPAIAKQRIAADLAAGRVRAAVPDDVIDRQYAQLQALVPKLEEFRSVYGIEIEEVISK